MDLSNFFPQMIQVTMSLFSLALVMGGFILGIWLTIKLIRVLTLVESILRDEAARRGIPIEGDGARPPAQR
jgi:hypothetical protein